MPSTREVKHFIDDDIDLEDIISKPKTRKRSSVERELIEEAAHVSNFPSREPVKKKIRKKSPYINQKNIKMRFGMSELLADLTKHLGFSSDQETIEVALGALIDKKGLTSIKEQYLNLINS